LKSLFSASEEDKDQNRSDNENRQNFTLAKQYRQHCDFVSRFIRTKTKLTYFLNDSFGETFAVIIAKTQRNMPVSSAGGAFLSSPAFRDAGQW
jgi:hypothetical protein